MVLTRRSSRFMPEVWRRARFRDICKRFTEPEISPALVSSATDAVLEEVRAWQSRPLDGVYPILYLDALIVKVKENRRVINKSVYLVIGVNLQGLKEVLGIWIAETAGRKILALDCDRTARNAAFLMCSSLVWTDLKDSRSHRSGLSENPSLALSGASVAAFPALCFLQGTDTKSLPIWSWSISPRLRKKLKIAFWNLSKNGKVGIRWLLGRGSRIGRESSRCSLSRRKSGGRFTRPTRLNRWISVLERSSKIAPCFRMIKPSRKSYFRRCAHIAKK